MAKPLVKRGVKKLRLTDFRSYGFLSLDLDPSLCPVVLSGKNGAGKTNLLEAVSFLAPGRGLRRARLSDVARHTMSADFLQGAGEGRFCAGTEGSFGFSSFTGGNGSFDGQESRPMAPGTGFNESSGINSGVDSRFVSGAFEAGCEAGWEEEPSRARSFGKVIELPKSWSVYAHLLTESGPVEVGTGVTPSSGKRSIKINGQPVRSQADLSGCLSVLWLTPTMDRLFCSDPSSRRHFLDRLVQSFDPLHAVRSADYSHALKQWGCLLKEGRWNEGWLSSLEEVMALNGVAICAARKDVVARLSGFLAQGDEGHLFPQAHIRLKGMLESVLDTMPALQAEEFFKEKIKASRRIYADGGNFAGPHTSDFSVCYREKNMDASLCSTGEQKALLVSIILAQTKAQMKEKGVCPMLLLDEVTAHLDKSRQEALLEMLLRMPAQVWLTGTDVSVFKPLEGKAQFFNIENSEAFALTAAA